MRRCSAVQRTCRSWQAKRWTSYDRSTLTDEALLAHIESGLGDDERGKPVRIDTEKKTVSTAGGDLPISPLFEPSWIRSRRRVTKEEPRSPTGRFRRKLIWNPYARALATPIRLCGVTQLALPRYFLQDFEVINHPETNDLWYAPGPLTFKELGSLPEPSEPGEVEPTVDASSANENDVQQESKGRKMDGRSANEGAPTASSTPGPLVEDDSDTSDIIPYDQDPEKRGKGHVTGYVLADRPLLRFIGEAKKNAGKLLGGRTGMGYRPAYRNAVFRPDMNDVLLKMMQQAVVDALIARGTASEHFSPQQQIEQVESWDDVKNVKQRGSVLLLRADDGATKTTTEDGVSNTAPFPGYVTLDVSGASYDRKMPVYDLNRLLGTDEVARLRASAPALFGQDGGQGRRSGEQKYVLKRKSSRSSTNLHLLLWRLEGYLAENRAPAPSA